MLSFRRQLTTLINEHSLETKSGTPDFVLSQFLSDCLDAYDKASIERRKFFQESPTVEEIHRGRDNA